MSAPDLTPALKTRLADDATLAGLLATYSGAPAIFMFDPVPGDAALPYLKSDGNTDVRMVSMDGALYEVDRSIRCYSDAAGDAGDVEAIARRVYDLLTTDLSVTGFRTIHVIRRGPAEADEDVESYVREVDFTVILEAT